MILCGGHGARLWPLFQSRFPQQFLALSGDGPGKSLFQQAISRIHTIASPHIQFKTTNILTKEEHWIMVKGTAEITNYSRVITLPKNQSTFIPQGQTHRPANLRNTQLEIIDVQSGSYLGKDDIVRYEDIYGRS